MTGAAGAGVLVLGGPTLAGRIGAIAGTDGVARVDRSAERLERPPRGRWTQTVIGESREGRPMVVHQNVAPDPRASVVVIAAMHGNERGIGPAAMGFTNAVVPEGVNVYVLPYANPDGWAANQRRNANGVDLNRNFPVRWRRTAISGPSPASEPETRAMMELVEGIRPTVTVWMHETLVYVGHITPAAVPYAEAWPARSVTRPGPSSSTAAGSRGPAGARPAVGPGRGGVARSHCVGPDHPPARLRRAPLRALTDRDLARPAVPTAPPLRPVPPTRVTSAP